MLQQQFAYGSIQCLDVLQLKRVVAGMVGTQEKVKTLMMYYFLICDECFFQPNPVNVHILVLGDWAAEHQLFENMLHAHWMHNCS